jgi:signal transduction histidine kinase
LYIDDDSINRKLVNRLLSSYGFTVLEADTGMAGLQIAQEQQPDLILMDIGMPGLDGYETTTRMRTLRGLKNTPIVAVTAHVTPGTREMALTAGCDGYIPKPIDVDEFPHQVIAYLNGKRDTMPPGERELYLGKYSQKLVERLEAKIMELEEANLRLQKVDKIKSDFITVAAHELRTPITLVYGYAKLLQQLTQPKDNEPAKYGGVSDLATRIYQSVYRLSDVVNDILNVSLIDADEMRLEQNSVYMEAVISAALQELAPNKNERDITITTKNLTDLPPVIGDERRLRQVFWNILSNAIKFTPDGGSILIKGWVTAPGGDSSATTGNNGSPAGRTEQGSIIVMVQDSGIGIAASEQKDIFERFYMVEDTAYHSSSKIAFKGGGIGLGLPIAKGIIEAHGGRIWVESQGRNEQETPGSKFFVLLPLHH